MPLRDGQGLTATAPSPEQMMAADDEDRRRRLRSAVAVQIDAVADDGL